MFEAEDAMFSELGALLDAVDLSAPSVTKFDGVKAWIAAKAGLDAKRVACFYVSKAGNFDVRFRQPSVMRDRPVLGWALVPRAVDLDPFRRPARRLVANGLFEAMAVFERTETGWRIDNVFVRGNASFDPTLGGSIGRDRVTVLEAAPILVPDAPYGTSEFEEETGLPAATAIDWLSRLRRKGQLVIQGPPGTGKTWVAERLGRLLVGAGRGFVDAVQFHPAYGYEDFVSGLAPVVRPDGGLAYEVRAGRFLEFCELAREAGNDPCVLIIDEFNRADLSRVFGELMYLLEYRGKSIRLANGPDDGRFSVPANVHLIATMNTADRSIALIDHALRRRFSFVRLSPDYGILRRRLERDGIEADPLLALIAELNDEISDPDFEIGISFFMSGGAGLLDLMPAIWDGEIVPYVREIMYARPDAVRRWSWNSVKPRLTSWYHDEEGARGPA